MSGLREKFKDDEAAVSAEEEMRNEQIEEGTREGKTLSTDAELAPLFDTEEAERFHKHWLEIQSKFVDDPEVAVRSADELVAHVIKNIMNNFADRRIEMEKQWKNDETVSTEDLRLTLQRYRSFFDRLLSLES